MEDYCESRRRGRRDISHLTAWLDTPIIGDVIPENAPRLPHSKIPHAPMLHADAGGTDGFWVAAATLAGLNHLGSGSNCQDAYAFDHRNGAVAVAVGDGLGSRPSSQIGALIATSIAVNRLVSFPASDLWHQPEAAARDAIVAANQHLVQSAPGLVPGGRIEDLSTTLGVLLIERRGQDVWALASRVGDTNVFAVSDGVFANAFHIAHGPRNIVHACLPVAGVPSIETEVFDVSDTEWVLAATDGLANDIIDSPGVRRWLLQLLTEPAESLRLLNAMSYRRQGSHDDRTGVAIWRWDGNDELSSTARVRKDHPGHESPSSVDDVPTHRSDRERGSGFWRLLQKLLSRG